MKEKGKVIEVRENMAMVLMEETEKCKGCNLCKKIIPRQPIISAKNLIGANIGDIVEVEIDEDVLFKISLFIYGFPLLGFLLGVIISYLIKNFYLKFPVFFFFLIFFWIYGFKKGKNYSEKVKPKIIKKL